MLSQGGLAIECIPWTKQGRVPQTVETESLPYDPFLWTGSACSVGSRNLSHASDGNPWPELCPFMLLHTPKRRNLPSCTHWQVLTPGSPLSRFDESSSASCSNGTESLLSPSQVTNEFSHFISTNPTSLHRCPNMPSSMSV